MLPPTFTVLGEIEATEDRAVEERDLGIVD
jgi:hypothetical protein